MEKNFGISVTGGTVKAGAMAAGAQASASSVTNIADQPQSLDELRAELSALVEAIRTQAPALPDGAQSIAVSELASRELGKEHPEKHSFLGLMQSLAAGIASIGSLAGAVASIQQAAASIL